MTLNEQTRIYVAGHAGMVGSATMRLLKNRGFRNLIVRTRAELDLLDQAAVENFFATEKIDAAIIAAAKVGGIWANSTHPARFMYENTMLAGNVINSAANNGVGKLVFLGSSCIYPKLAPQPIKEESLLSSPLEPTNEAYALAKIAGLKLCEMYYKQYGKKFVSVMPTNLYGQNDSFHPLNSHVIPGMMRRLHEAKNANSEFVWVWGTGTVLREFLYVDDLAEALLTILKNYESPDTINVGGGLELSIAELATVMAKVIGFKGEIRFDESKPDGTPRKILDSSKILKMDWSPKIDLVTGLAKTYKWALENDVFDRPTKEPVSFTNS